MRLSSWKPTEMIFLSKPLSIWPTGLIHTTPACLAAGQAHPARALFQIELISIYIVPLVPQDTGTNMKAL